MRVENGKWEYEGKDSVGYVELAISNRPTGNEHFRTVELKSPIIDKDAFWKEYLVFLGGYLDRQQESLEKTVGL